MKWPVLLLIFPFLYSRFKWLKSIKPIWGILRPLYFFLIPKRELEIEVDGHKMFINPKDQGIGQKLFLFGSYAPGRTQIISAICDEGQTALDLGANIGYFTLKLARLVGPKGKVIAFEPDRRNFELLVKNINANNYTNVFPVRKAVSNTNQTGRFYLSPGTTDNTLSFQEGRISEEIEIIELDTFLNKIGITSVDFVKMDMDGSEPLAIKGLHRIISANPDIKILAEYTPENLRRYINDPMDFMNMAAECGLKLIDIADCDKGSLKTTDTAILSLLSEQDDLDLLLSR